MNIRRGPPGRMGRTAAHLRVDCTGPGLSAFGAAATEVERVLARLDVDHELPYRYPAIVAGVGCFVRFPRWLWFGCGRVIHGGLLSRLSGSREILGGLSAGPFLYVVLSSHIFKLLAGFFLVCFNTWKHRRREDGADTETQRVARDACPISSGASRASRPEFAQRCGLRGRCRRETVHSPQAGRSLRRRSYRTSWRHRTPFRRSAALARTA